VQKQIDKVLSNYKGVESELIPILQNLQDVLGYLPPEAMTETARFLNIAETSVYGVTTFYTQFQLSQPGRNIIKVCQGTACHVRGAKKIADAVHKKIGIGPGQTSEDGEFSVERVACIGSCALAPAVVGGDKIHGPMTPEKMEDLIDEIRCDCQVDEKE